MLLYCYYFSVNLLFLITKQILTEDKSEQQEDIKIKLYFVFSKCEEMCPQLEGSGFSCNIHVEKNQYMKILHLYFTVTSAVGLISWEAHKKNKNGLLFARVG